MGEKIDSLLLELERAGWEVLDVKTLKEKDALAQKILRIKADIRKALEVK